MAIDPAILRAMQAAGASIDVIIAAVEADAALDSERVETRRAKDAERQRRHRASRRVTVTECDNADSVTDAPLSLPPNENISNPPTHTPPDIYTPPAREADPFPKPEWTTAQIWRDFKANRKAKRLPCTATAHAKLLRDIEKLTCDEWPPGRLLEAIVGRGWAAAYDPREETGNGRNQNNRGLPANVDRRDGVDIALDRRLGLNQPSGPSERRDAGPGGGHSFLALAAAGDG